MMVCQLESDGNLKSLSQNEKNVIKMLFNTHCKPFLLCQFSLGLKD